MTNNNKYFIPNWNDLLDIVSNNNEVPNNYFTLWPLFMKWQHESMLKLGLKKNNTLLDIGCGAGRYGVKAVDYLDNSNYFGIDSSMSYINIADEILTKTNPNKDFFLLIDDKFQFDKFGVSFDFAIAQSVVTHITLNQFKTLIKNLYNVMNKGGVFLYTYIWHGIEIVDGFSDYGDLYMTKERYDPIVINELCKMMNINLHFVDLGHPSGQSTAVIEF